MISCVVGNFYLYSRWMNLLYTSVNLVITENIVNTKEEDNSNKIVCFFPSESDFLVEKRNAEKPRCRRIVR